MRYFLDFDRTLFDTDSFKRYLASRDHDASITGEPEEDVARRLNELVRSGTLSFALGELAPFVYEDARLFLTAHADEVTIITFGNVEFQRIKVESALSQEYAAQSLYTGDVLKGDFLSSSPSYAGERAWYVDDRVHELERMQETCPQIVAYEMRRDGGEGDGRWSVLRSFNDLPTP